MSNIITQVSQEQAQFNTPEDDYNSIINLSVRGVSFQITRDELMSLPESILLCLFPTGAFLDENGQSITNLSDNDVVYVDFSSECFQYIVEKFSKAASSMPRHHQIEINEIDVSVLRTKPAIIVLREDLDFYCIPPVVGLSSFQMKKIKTKVGNLLSRNSKIFDGLGYGEDKPPLGPAEQHLLDMLCNAGYSVADDWGHRDLEPGKSVISSLALVQLNPDRASQEANSKLLLFWKKPARKCWWSYDTLSVEARGIYEGVAQIRVHIRRVWTLELAVLSQ